MSFKLISVSLSIHVKQNLDSLTNFQYIKEQAKICKNKTLGNHILMFDVISSKSMSGFGQEFHFDQNEKRHYPD